MLLAYGLTQDPRVLPTALKAKAAPGFKLKRMMHPDEMVDETVFKNHFTVVNLWASWCTPCRIEHNVLLKLHQSHQKIMWLGINYKDDPNLARQYLQALGNPYDVVIADTTGVLGMDWGIYGTPETFLVDKSGHVLHRHAGVIDETIWNREFEPLLQQS